MYTIETTEICTTLLLTTCFSICYNSPIDDEIMLGLKSIINSNFPSADVVEPPIVYIWVGVESILDVDEIRGLITVKVSNLVHYFVPAVKELLENYTRLETFVVPKGTFWGPELRFRELVDVKFTDHDHQYVKRDGIILVEYSKENIIYKCNLKLKAYPFDEHWCPLTVEDRIGGYTGLYFEGSSLSEFQSGWAANDEWELMDPQKFYKTWDTDCGKDCVGVLFVKIKRKPKYFVSFCILPSVLLGATSAITFFVPIGEKVTFSMSILLAHMVSLMATSQVVPLDGKDLTCIGQYILLQIISTALIILAASIVEVIYSKRTHKNFPVTLQYILQSKVMYLLCIKPIGRGRSATDTDLSANDILSSKDQGFEVLYDMLKIVFHSSHGAARSWEKFAEVVNRLFLLFYALIYIMLTFSLGYCIYSNRQVMLEKALEEYKN